MNMKFVVALNRGFDLARLTSGIGHVTAGLVASQACSLDKLSFVEYRSSDNKSYPWISDWPFIILKARGGQLRTFRDALVQLGLPSTVYLDTMLTGGSEAQQKATQKRTSEELTYLAVATFGER